MNTGDNKYILSLLFKLRNQKDEIYADNSEERQCLKFFGMANNGMGGVNHGKNCP